MKMLLNLPYEKHPWMSFLKPPTFYSGERLVKDDAERNIRTIEIEVNQNQLSRLQGHTEQLITVDNADEVWEAIKKAFDVNRTAWFPYGVIFTRLLAVKGWLNYGELYNIEYDQIGYGYMGGTGCGRLVHEISYSKIVSVKYDSIADPRKWVWAQLLFKCMAGEVKALRDHNKHLRENIEEKDIFVTLNARPTCQKTVAYRGARGFLLKSGGLKHLTCIHCAKNLGVKVEAKRPKTPANADRENYKGWTVQVFRNTARMTRTYHVTFRHTDGSEATQAEKLAFKGKTEVMCRGTKAESLKYGVEYLRRTLTI